MKNDTFAHYQTVSTFSLSWRHQEHRENRTILRTLADVSVILRKKLKPLSVQLKEIEIEDMVRGPMNFNREHNNKKICSESGNASYCVKDLKTSKVAVWVHSYEDKARPVKTAKAKQNIMTDLQKFAEFLPVKYGRNQQVVEFDILIQKIRDRRNLLQKEGNIYTSTPRETHFFYYFCSLFLFGNHDEKNDFQRNLKSK